MKITIRTPQMQDYDRFSAIMDQVQQMHVEWRPDVYKPASPLITKEVFGELLKGDSWYIAETDGIVVGVLEVFKLNQHVGPAFAHGGDEFLNERHVFGTGNTVLTQPHVKRIFKNSSLLVPTSRVTGSARCGLTPAQAV